MNQAISCLTTRRLGLALWATLAAVSVPVSAEETETDPYSLSLGAFFVQRTDSQFRVDKQTTGAVSVGATVDWESDLGGDTRMTVGRLDGYYRFAPKHRIDYSWYRIDREGSRTLQRTIEVGDTVFSAGTHLTSNLLTDTVKATYTYSFYRMPEIETSVSAGLFVNRVKASIIADSIGVSEASSVTAPLPVFGFRIAYAVAPQWWVKSDYQLFFLDKVENVQGAFSDFTLTAEYLATKHLGIGFGMNRAALSVEASDSEWRGRLDTVLNGYLLYVTIR